MKRIIYCFIILIFALISNPFVYGQYFRTIKAIMEVNGRPASNDNLGSSAAAVGDINGDGYLDFAIGAEGIGKSYIYFGGPGTLDDKPDIVLNHSIMLTGDINGDGYKDLICTSRDTITGVHPFYVYFGKSDSHFKIDTIPGFVFKGVTNNNGSELLSDIDFGISRAIGDLNGDGYDDVAFTSRYIDTALNRYKSIKIWMGKKNLLSPPDFLVYGDNKKQDISLLVKIADVNGDGFGDLIVGSDFYVKGGYPNYSYLDIYYGKSNWTFNWGHPDQRIDSRILGHKLGLYSGFVDLNNDGISDIFVVDKDTSFIYLGRKDSFQLKPDFYLLNPAPDRIKAFRGNEPITSIGDVNGDGYKDFAVRITYEGGIPVLCVYLGNSKGITKEPCAIRGKIDDNGGYGEWKIPVGDVNGDGLDDFITTSEYDNFPLFNQPGYFVVLTGERDWIVPVSRLKDKPDNLSLIQNFPNPFNNSTVIKYIVPKEDMISIKIFDINGKEVKLLSEKTQLPREYSIEWDGKNNMGKYVGSGTYFCRLYSSNKILTSKMVLLK
jgi:hypothetical protein